MNKIQPTKPFIQTIFFGFLTSIFLAAIIMVIAHLLIGLSWLIAVIISTICLVIFAFISSVISSRILGHPLEKINEQLDELNDQVSSSSSTIAQLNKRSEAMFDSLPLGLIVFDHKTELTHINDLAKKMLGLGNDQLPVSPVNTESVMAIIKQLSIGISPIGFTDWLHQTKANKIQETKVWPMAQITVNEETKAFDVLAHYNKQDTYGYELVIMLVDKNDQYLGQEKQMEFISLAAHELRGPITLMRGLIDVFKNELGETLDSDHMELLTRMEVSSHQLSGYVDNILSVSRIDQKNFVVNLEKEDWGTVLRQATVDLAIRAKANRRILELNLPPDIPPVAVDTTAITHVINNLIDNAIKYSRPGGRIVVSASIKGDQVETVVQDSGIGIPASLVGGLFTKFYRSHRSKQLVSGTGLGLYLSKAVVEAHGGTIWVRSTEGLGSTFGFTLPTFESVADKLAKGDNKESGIVRGTHGWIKNHALYRR